MRRLMCLRSLKDWSNPLVREHIRLYPEDAKAKSEILHGDKAAPKAIDVSDIDLYPHMWADWEGAPHRHFYVREVSRMRDGRFVLVLRWIVVDKHVCADVQILGYNKEV